MVRGMRVEKGVKGPGQAMLWGKDVPHRGTGRWSGWVGATLVYSRTAGEQGGWAH